MTLRLFAPNCAIGCGAFCRLQTELRQRRPCGGHWRGSKHAADGKGALHLVSAWAHEASLILAQQAVEGKSNEITAIPGLLDMLELEGAIVTIDAMGTQKDIAARIIARKAAYVLALKGNQGTLQDAAAWLAERHPEWTGLASIASVTVRRTIKKTGTVSTQTRL